jgi:hypothetical protein
LYLFAFFFNCLKPLIQADLPFPKSSSLTKSKTNMKRITFFMTIGIAICIWSCSPGTKTETTTQETKADSSLFKVILVKHPVKDYNAWKPVYMAHDSMRNAYGITKLGIGRGLEDTNMVLVINEISDLQKAKDFAGSADLKDAMGRAGVTGAPTINYVDVVRNDTSDIGTDVRLMITHHVSDYNQFLKVYDGEGKATRASHGLVDRGMGRDLEDPTQIWILFAVTDMEKAKARMNSEELKKLMADAGMQGAPQFFFYTLQKD